MGTRSLIRESVDARDRRVACLRGSGVGGLAQRGHERLAVALELGRTDAGDQHQCSALDVGLRRAISASVWSWKTTYGGTSVLRATSSRQRRRASNRAPTSALSILERGCARATVCDPRDDERGRVGADVDLDGLLATRTALPRGVMPSVGFSPWPRLTHPSSTRRSSRSRIRSTSQLRSAPNNCSSVTHERDAVHASIATAKDRRDAHAAEVAVESRHAGERGVHIRGDRRSRTALRSRSRQLSHAMQVRATPCSPK